MARSARASGGSWRLRAAVLGALVAAAPLATWSPPTAQAGSLMPSYEHATAGHVHHLGGSPLAAYGVGQAGLTDSPAAGLRVTLNMLLGEHVYLAARATGAALNGQTAAFEAAAASLDQNSVDLSRAIGMAYGPEAEAAFLPLWRAHIGMIVDYTVGKATDDQAKQDKAVADLVGYTQDFGAFLSAANERLPKDVVAELVRDHVLTLKDVIDAQAARDQDKVYSSLRTAIGHMGMIADPLAGATAAQFPDKFGGDPMTPAVGYRVAVNNLLTEHVYLAASAALGGLSGNQAQFNAAAAALDGNSVDVARGIGLAYGPEAEAAFLPLWRAHIGMLVDYTVGKATDDQAKQDKAVADLVGYTQDFGAFLNAANENLPKDVVADLVKSHVVTLKEVVDTQKAGNPTAHFAAVRMAAGHMGMIADPLAEATVGKFPDKFAASPAPAPVGHTMVGHMLSLDSATAPIGASQVPAAAAEVRLFTFRPSALEVAAGTSITWTNGDAVEHSVTAEDGSSDSGFFTQGQSYTTTFEQPGEYRYYCMRHPSMQGTVVVTEAVQ